MRLFKILADLFALLWPKKSWDFCRLVWDSVQLAYLLPIFEAFSIEYFLWEEQLLPLSFPYFRPWSESRKKWFRLGFRIRILGFSFEFRILFRIHFCVWAWACQYSTNTRWKSGQNGIFSHKIYKRTKIRSLVSLAYIYLVHSTQTRAQRHFAPGLDLLYGRATTYEEFRNNANACSPQILSTFTNFHQSGTLSSIQNFSSTRGSVRRCRIFFPWQFDAELSARCVYKCE